MLSMQHGRPTRLLYVSKYQQDFFVTERTYRSSNRQDFYMPYMNNRINMVFVWNRFYITRTIIISLLYAIQDHHIFFMSYKTKWSSLWFRRLAGFLHVKEDQHVIYMSRKANMAPVWRWEREGLLCDRRYQMFNFGNHTILHVNEALERERENGE